MKSLMVLSLVIWLSTITLAAVEAISENYYFLEEEQQLWNHFKITFDKKYDDVLEDTARFAIFKENLAKIELHNEKYDSGQSSYKLGVNQFADMTQDEFVISLITYNRSRNNLNRGNWGQLPNKVIRIAPGSKLPSQVDWNKLGAVTPVKDQKNCGSCWSFSATGSLEGQYFLKTNKLVSLSEQNLMDCSYQYQNHGCDGGFMDNAFQYVSDFGIMTEENYPYDAIDNACSFNASESVFKISSYIDLESGSESMLKSAVATVGPISVAVDALNFALYAEGIFDDDKCCSFDYCLSHGVLVVGYGTSEDVVDYWLVKNSWGTSWGEEGYIRMSRNKNNQCGVATQPSYPVL